MASTCHPWHRNVDVGHYGAVCFVASGFPRTAQLPLRGIP